jgi:short-subunit dehydrogenase
MKTYSLITGASAGIGASIAEVLAEKGYNLIITARRADRLKELAKNLEAKYSIEVVCVTADLSDPKAPQALYDFCLENKYIVDLLVNNAGYGIYDAFAEVSIDQHEAMIRVLSTSVITLTCLFLPEMKKRRQGKVMIVSSISAYLPSAGEHGLLYAPLKTFMNSFGKALNLAYRPYGISTTVVCPGYTSTEFHSVCGLQEKVDALPSYMKMSSMAVARAAVTATLKRKSVHIPGLLNRIIILLIRLNPMRLIKRLRAKQI